MANRFDRAADAQFINTYAPIPFQELAQAAQMRQNTYDQNSARVDAAIAAADDLLAIPNSADARRADEIRASLSKVSDEFAGQDLSDPEIYRSLKKKIRQIASPGEVKSIQQSYAGWQNYKKLENQMKAKGQAVYNPYDFTGYDSFNTGVFTDTPTMDLGAQAEDAINKFMSKPELKYREVELDSGRVGIEHYRDVDEINNLINSESGELLRNPAIQQLMEREGLDEEGFKQFLAERAPSYIDAKLTSAAWRPQSQNSGSSFAGGFMGTQGTAVEEADVEDLDKRQLEKQRQNNLNVINDPNANPELKNKALSENAEIEATFEQARDLAEEIAGDNLLAAMQPVKEEVKNLKFLKNNPTLNNTVVSLVEEYLQDNKLNAPTFETTGGSNPYNPVSTIKTFPGEERLAEDLEGFGLNKREVNKVVDRYTDYFKKNRKEVSDYRNAENDYIKSRMSGTASETRTMQYPYKYSSGLTEFKNIFNKGEYEQSNIARIGMDVAKDEEDYENVLDEDNASPKKSRKLLKSISDGKTIPGEITVASDLKLSDTPGVQPGIKLNMGVYPKSKENKPILNELQGDVDVVVRGASPKNQVIEELYKRGDFDTAYRVSKIAGSLDRGMRYISPSNPVEFAITDNEKVSITQEGNVYKVSVLAEGQEPRVQEFSNKGQATEFTHSMLNNLFKDIGAQYGLPYAPIDKDPGLRKRFLW